MKLVKWELKIGFFKGLLLGMRHYYFKSKDEEVFEEDVVIYIGVSSNSNNTNKSKEWRLMRYLKDGG